MTAWRVAVVIGYLVYAGGVVGWCLRDRIPESCISEPTPPQPHDRAADGVSLSAG